MRALPEPHRRFSLADAMLILPGSVAARAEMP